MAEWVCSSALTALFQKGYGLPSLKLDRILNNPSKHVLKVKQIPLVSDKVKPILGQGYELGKLLHVFIPTFYASTPQKSKGEV